MSKDILLTKIFIVESIPSGEPQTGEELYNDTIKRYNQLYRSEVELHFKKVTNKHSFFDFLNFVFDNISKNDKIIIHIEAHGSTDKKSLVLSNNEIISWGELTEKLIPINRKLKNGVHLFNISCFGNYISQLIDLKSTAPFKSFIGSQYDIYPNEIIDYYTSLYDKILESKDIYKAVHSLSKTDTVNKFFMKDVDFIATGVTYMQMEIILKKTNDYYMLKSLFDNYLNIDIDIIDMNKHKDPKIYILDLFRKRYFYRD